MTISRFKVVLTAGLSAASLVLVVVGLTDAAGAMAVGAVLAWVFA